MVARLTHIAGSPAMIARVFAILASIDLENASTAEFPLLGSSTCAVGSPVPAGARCRIDALFQPLG